MTKRHSGASRCTIAALFVLSCGLWFNNRVTGQQPFHPEPRLLVTDRSPLDLEPAFGGFAAPLGNTSGDVTWLGSGNSALFVRRAGTDAPERIFQMGDPIPGVESSVADIIGDHAINSHGAVSFSPFFSRPDAHNLRAIMVRDINGALTIVARNGADTAYASMAPAGFNDAGDVAFTAVPQGTSSASGQTLYLAPGGGLAVRLAGPGDTVAGTTGALAGIVPLSLNDSGEILFRATLTGGPDGSALFVASRSGIRKIVSPGDPSPLGPHTSVTAGFLNNSGTVAFSALGAAWIHAVDGGTQALATPSTSAPAPVGGALGVITVLGLNDAGQAALSSSITGSATTTQALLRATPGAPLEIVAYRNQPIPGGGRTFTTFPAVVLHEDGAIAFTSTLSGAGAASGLFQRAAGSAAIMLVQVGDGAPGGTGETFGSIANISTMGGDIVFRAALFNASAYEGVFAAGASGVRRIATTADPLPAGARISLRSPFVMGQNADYAVLRAFRTGGRVSLWRARLSSGELQRIAAEGDIAPGTSGGRLSLLATGSAVVSVNANGAVAFTSSVVGGTVGNGSGIFVMDPAGIVRKVAATNDVDAVSGRALASVTVPLGKPPVLNDAGQVVFRASLSGAPATTVVYLSNSSGPAARLLATGDAAPGGGTFTTLNSPMLDQSGVIALSGVVQATASSKTGIYLLQQGAIPQRLVEQGDLAPGGGTFDSAFPPAVWLNDQGQVAFKARVSGGSAGVFIASVQAGVEAIARHGQTSPAGGTYDLVTGFDGHAVVNTRGDVAFRSDLVGAGANSGYFIRRGPAGTTVAAALAGQAVRGTDGVLDGIGRPVNNALAEMFHLDDLGLLVFTNAIVGSGVSRFATIVASPESALTKVLARGDVLAATNGGLVVASAAQMMMTSSGRHVAWARLMGSQVASEAMIVVTTLDDSTPPAILGVPANTVVEATGPTGAVVSWPAPTAHDEFDGPLPVTCAPASGFSYPMGVTPVVCSAADAAGNGASGSFSVTVRDTTAPAISSVTPSQQLLWPPKHQMVPLFLTVNVTDVVTAAPMCAITGITSNEPVNAAGDGNTSGDWSFEGLKLAVRAERSGTGNGRVYTIAVSCTDGAGNSSSATTTVTVPKSQPQR